MGQLWLAYDPKEEETYDNKLSSLWLDFQFFYPLCGVERYRGVEENPADVKAAEKMAKLHDEIRRYNEFSSSDDIHDLNIFMTRLLFCFFAEDTGIFEDNLFTASIDQYTNEDGSDLAQYLDAAFNIMDKDVRIGVPSVISQFPYVNGGLFRKHIMIPQMSRRARKLIIECGGLNWKDINPDIFGSMIQAVVTPDKRGTLGMHYTSVPNIMKVISPLFLDELYEEFAKHKDNVKKLRLLLVRMSKMKFFDPACGSGNFLIIAYKELRKLEVQIWQRIAAISGQIEIPFVHIQLNQFYGIEIDDFAHEVAMLSLWLAEHQMNRMFTQSFSDVVIPALPLKTNCNIVHGNACRVDWNTVCPHTKEEEVFVMGNPPYLGSGLQEQSHKDDMEYVFENTIENYKKLDYISCWFYKASKYIKKQAKVGFVTTNSICQGEQVPLLWMPILQNNIEIFFSYVPFLWTNNAKNKAAVAVTILGLRKQCSDKKTIYKENTAKQVENINAYLIQYKDIYILPCRESISGFPEMIKGSSPGDGGNLLLETNEKDVLIENSPKASCFIKKYMGADEFVNSKIRYCLWIEEQDVNEALKIPTIKERISKCREFRLNSKKAATRQKATFSYAFDEKKYKGLPCIIVPQTGSERRKYLPAGLVDSETVVSNAARIIYNGGFALLGIVLSYIHMVWVRAIAGRLKNDMQYSNTLVYNTFPFPKISDEKRKEIEAAAEEILLVRADYPGSTLADLYDPDKMPDDLREAHHNLDLIVESCYRDKPFESDEERLECLFKLYEKMTKK